MTAAAQTRDRILDAAETLFAEKGFAATSLRAITTEAGANLAAVHYHFGSKEGLFEQVFVRRIGPINERRLELLDEAEAAAAQGGGGEAPPLEAVVEAFLRPAVHLAQEERGQRFMRLAGRIFSEPGEHWDRLAVHFDGVKDRMLAAMRRCLPELPPLDLFWRVHFMVGVMCHTLSDTHRLRLISNGLCDPTDVEAMLDQLVPFLCAGLRAPAPSPQLGGRE